MHLQIYKGPCVCRHLNRNVCGVSSEISKYCIMICILGKGDANIMQKENKRFKLAKFRFETDSGGFVDRFMITDNLLPMFDKYIPLIISTLLLVTCPSSKQDVNTQNGTMKMKKTD